MKYKNLKSFAHNFTHSFVSGVNRVEDEYVIEDLCKVARELSGEVLSIYWIPGNGPVSNKLSKTVLESLGYYWEWLPKLAAQHAVELGAIKEMRTDIYRKPNHQIEVMSRLEDDRGKKYQQVVKFGMIIRISDLIRDI